MPEVAIRQLGKLADKLCKNDEKYGADIFVKAFSYAKTLNFIERR